jgi:hypothetical protein
MKSRSRKPSKLDRRPGSRVLAWLRSASSGREDSHGQASGTVHVALGTGADVEHGPPTALCESRDPEAACPAGYDTKVLYGQIFCRPPAPVAAGAQAARSDTRRRQTAGL